MNGDEPRYVNSVIADKTVGLTVLAAISMALFHREKTGRGQRSKSPCSRRWWRSSWPNTSKARPSSRDRGRRATPARSTPIGNRTGPRTATSLCFLTPRGIGSGSFRATGRDDLADADWVSDAAQRSRRIAELYSAVAEVIPGRTTNEWLSLMEEIDVPAMPVMGPDEILENPHLNEIGFFPLFDHPTEGTLRFIGQAIRYGDTPATYRRGPPRLGEHTTEVLSEAGLSEAEIAALYEEGAAKEAPPNAA